MIIYKNTQPEYRLGRVYCPGTFFLRCSWSHKRKEFYLRKELVDGFYRVKLWQGNFLSAILEFDNGKMYWPMVSGRKMPVLTDLEGCKFYPYDNSQK